MADESKDRGEKVEEARYALTIPPQDKNFFSQKLAKVPAKKRLGGQNQTFLAQEVAEGAEVAAEKDWFGLSPNE